MVIESFGRMDDNIDNYKGGSEINEIKDRNSLVD